MNRPPFGLHLPCEIVRVLDGDTVEVVLPGSTRGLRVRLLDCWCAERYTDEGKIATDRMKHFVEMTSGATSLFIPAPESTVHILGEILTFGRILAHIFVGPTDTLSELMVDSNHALKEKPK